MKPNSLFYALSVLILFAICLAGCSNPSPAPTRATSSAPAASPVANQTASAPVAPADIAGDYNVSGTNVDGSPYQGSLAIIKRGDVYQFRWTAGKQYDGVAVQNGNVVAVAFTGGTEGQGCGVVSYQALADGTLDGKWGYWGTNEAGSEKATRAGGSGLAGDYEVTGKNPDGKAYQAKLAVAPEGSGYKFDWNNGSSGYGIKQGKSLTVGIGGPRCAFVAYEIKADGLLDGVWGGYGSDKTGTEKATRKK
jgi:hypothetical protein